jgi:polar amino acid transport system substrate-binding protein
MTPGRSFFLVAFSLVVSGLAIAATTSSMAPSSEVREALAPTGKLRVGINLQRIFLAKRNAVTGEVTGMAIDLGRMLAQRLGVMFEPVFYPNVGAVVEGAAAGAWDIAFLANDSARADVIEFTAPYIEVDNTYLVPADSPIRTVADADRPGVRIGVGLRNATGLFLKRTLKYAELVGTEGVGAVELLRSGKVDIAAGSRDGLLVVQEKLSGYRLLDDRFNAVGHAIALPRGRASGLVYVNAFVEEIKGSGVVAQAIAQHSIRGINVAPRTTR